MAYLAFILMLPILLSALTRLNLHQVAAQFCGQHSLLQAQTCPPISILLSVRGLDY